MSNSVWVGVDLSKNDFWVALASDADAVADWAKLPTRSFAFSVQGIEEFVAWVRERVEDESLAGICIESTGRLGWRWLGLLGDELVGVSMENPARTKAFGDSMGLRDKTDRIDACVLALYGVAMRPKIKGIPSPTLLELRECNRLFSSLSADRQAYVKRLKDGPTSRVVCRELKQTVTVLENRMTKIQDRMDELIEQDEQLHEDVKRITSIVGVGKRSAYVMLSECGDIRGYSRNELVSFAGVYPRTHESGSSVRKKPRLARKGGARIRKALFLCAMSARVHNPQMKRFYERLRQNGKAPMAALGAIMRKLLLIVRSLLIQNVDYDRNFT